MPAALGAGLSHSGGVRTNGAQGLWKRRAAEPHWKTLRFSHFPTASTAAGLNLEVLCSKPQPGECLITNGLKMGQVTTVQE